MRGDDKWRPSMTDTVILHLSDLHFGGDWDATETAKRESVLSGLIDVLTDVEPEWTPQCIAITGDIAWKGNDSDYREAESWLERLLGATSLKPDDVFVCAGNHDIDRTQSKTYARPSTSGEADEILRVPVAEQYEKAFAQFSAFCSRNNIPKLLIGDFESYLVGFREHSGIRFLSVNSSWFCKDENDKGRLWIGLEHLRYLDGRKQLPVVAQNPSSRTTICLLHHPKESLHEDEQHSYGLRPNTFDFLAKRCHVILTGHTHGEIRSADRIGGSAWHFTAGAAYGNAAHFNSFRLIRVRSDGVDHRAFEFDPRGAASPWKEIGDGATCLPF